MKITELLVTYLKIPRTSTLTTSYGSENSAPTLLIELKTDRIFSA